MTIELKKMKKIIDIIERILELNSEKPLGLRLKILTLDQMHKLLYSLYRSKKL